MTKTLNMSNDYFRFKEFTINQDKCAMKISTDAVLLGAWVKLNGCKRVLDVGTGTGILSLMVAQRFKGSIDALEIDAEAFTQAKSNIKRSLWYDRINLFHISFQEYVVKFKAKYSLVICNPPFFTSYLKSDNIKRNLARNTQSLSLFELVKNASLMLNNNGKIAVILPYELRNKFVKIVRQKNLDISRQTVVRHSKLHPPSRVLFEVRKKKVFNTEVDELVIQDISGNGFSTDYINLTRVYYLNL